MGNFTSEVKVTGIIGHPVCHSLSPAMHNAAYRAVGLDYIYIPFNVHPDNLKKAVEGVRALSMIGVNVTIPHKEKVIPLLDWVSEDAKRIGSVNTIHNVDGTLKGYSTDGEGFIAALDREGKSPDGSDAVILGAGGSARAILYALASRSKRLTVVNRTKVRAEELVNAVSRDIDSTPIQAVQANTDEAREAVRTADLLINCTSVGMYPNIEMQPVPNEWLHKGLFVYDLIYNPRETKLLKGAREVGARGADGVGMLVFQGTAAFRIWTGRVPPAEVMEESVRERLGTVS